MLLWKEMRAMAVSLSLQNFCKQLGPFALIQQPPEMASASFDSLGLPLNLAVTTPAGREEVQKGSLALLFALEDLAITTLPPLRSQDELAVGRQPDCDLVIDHPSVSKRHALLRWNSANGCCTIQDTGSTNGTLLNGGSMVRSEVSLHDGDIISFGQAHFWFLHTKTLHARLSHPSGSDLLGSRSG